MPRHLFISPYIEGKEYKKSRFYTISYSVSASVPMSFKQEDIQAVPSFNEQKWVTTVQQVLQEEADADDLDHVSISIFDVPRSLTANKPEAYTPQHVSIGPYHLWRTELYEMRRHKLHAARRTQKLLPNQLKFQDIVDHFAKHELKIRAFYHKFLDFNGETLAWMMALDASLLIEFLQIISAKRGKVLPRISSSIIASPFIHGAGNNSLHIAIQRDIMMLENQIPLFVLRDLMEVLIPKADESLAVLLKVLYREVSPFKNLNIFPPLEELSERNHLLELLYYMIVPYKEDSSEIQQRQINKEEPSLRFSSPKKLFNSPANSAPASRRVLTSEKITNLAKRSWSFATKVAPSSKKEPIENIISSVEIVVDEVEDKESSSELLLAEELQIPSVADLTSVGIKFRATNGGLSSIKFDLASLIFYLPVITLDENSEVILRNLVAFEACAVTGPLIFTRYTELMNGIIDTEEDVSLLRKQGIIVNYLRSDGEVADLWNGMSKSLKLTKVGFLDKAIEDVNRYYGGKWKVRSSNLLKKYVYAFWPILTLLATIILLLSTCVQAVCSVYNCTGVVKYID